MTPNTFYSPQIKHMFGTNKLNEYQNVLTTAIVLSNLNAINRESLLFF